MRLGCSDHSCQLERPRGQGTNGGCSCVNGKMSTEEQLRVKKYICKIKKHNELLCELILAQPGGCASCPLYEMDKNSWWVCTRCEYE